MTKKTLLNCFIEAQARMNGRAEKLAAAWEDISHLLISATRRAVLQIEQRLRQGKANEVVLGGIRTPLVTNLTVTRSRSLRVSFLEGGRYL